MQNKDVCTFTFDDFLDLVPIEYRDLSNYQNEDIIIQFLHDLDFIHRNIQEGNINKDEVFILVKKDFTLNIKKFLKNYNKGLGEQFPLQFLLNYINESGRPEESVYSFIVAPRMNINFFKLVNEVRGITINSLDDELKEKMPDRKRQIEYLAEQLSYMKTKKSIRLFQTLTY